MVNTSEKNERDPALSSFYKKCITVICAIKWPELYSYFNAHFNVYLLSTKCLTVMGFFFNHFGLFINRLSKRIRVTWFLESVKRCLPSETFNFKLKCIAPNGHLPKGMKNRVVKIRLWIKKLLSDLWIRIW